MKIEVEIILPEKIGNSHEAFITGQDVSYLSELQLKKVIRYGDPTKAKKQFGWESQVTFEKPVNIMVKADWESIRKKQ